MGALLPLLSLGKDTGRSNPSQSTSSHDKKNISSWPNETKDSKEKYEAISNHAYKRSKKTQIIFMDETDHELKIHRIPTNTPQKFTSNRSPRDHCIENHKRERERKPSSYCLWTRRTMVDYSCIIGEAPIDGDIYLG